MFDYVIVGAGSAGCVLANRLSWGGRHRVCLLEAGPPDVGPAIQDPSAWSIAQLLRSRKYNWQFWTEPQVNMNGRRLFWPRGRVVGGSSSINAMIYIRGSRKDFDTWALLGNDGWAFHDLLPYFRKSENCERGADAFRGIEGPLNVADRLGAVSPVAHAFLKAAGQSGHASNADFNGAEQQGFGFYQVTQKNGQRWSNASAYLGEAQSRQNLTLITGAVATRIVFSADRARAVEYLIDGSLQKVEASREIIVAAGAIGSPHLLLLSGVGPRQELERHGIECQLDLPGVGKNLQDHLNVAISVRSCGAPIVHATENRIRRAGGSLAEAGGFLRSDETELHPDLQMHFSPMVDANHGFNLRNRVSVAGYSLATCVLRPASRGRLTLHSADPMAAPCIDPNYLSDPRDLVKMVAAVRRAREILARPALDAFREEELEPGEALQTDEQLAEFVRNHAETFYHPVGTCRMGQGSDAVVDACLRVRGLDGLRIADASIMPTIVSGNTNAATTVIAERAAGLILSGSAAVPALAEYS